MSDSVPPLPASISSFYAAQTAASSPAPKPPTANFWLLLGGCMFAVIGFLFPLAAVLEIHNALSCKSTPDELLCATLADYRPTANRYVTLIDAFPCPFAYQSRTEKGAWEVVDVPVGPRVHGENHARAENIHVVVTSSEFRDVDALMAELEDGRVTGMLTRRGVARNQILEDGNPGIRLEECWTLIHNRKPSQPAGWYAAWVAFGIVCAAGVAAVHLATRRPLGDAWFGLMATGPLIWLLVGIGVASRGRKGLSAPVLMMLFLLSGTAVVLAGALIVQQYLIGESDGGRFAGAMVVSLGTALLGYGAYFTVQTLLQTEEATAGAAIGETAALGLAGPIDPAAQPSPAPPAPASVPLSKIGQYLFYAGLGPILVVALRLMSDPGSLTPPVTMTLLAIGMPLAFAGVWLWLAPENATQRPEQ